MITVVVTIHIGFAFSVFFPMSSLRTGNFVFSLKYFLEAETMKYSNLKVVMLIFCIREITCKLDFQKTIEERSISAISSLIKHVTPKESSRLSLVLCSQNINYEKQILNQLLTSLNLSLSYNIGNCHNVSSFVKTNFLVLLTDLANAHIIHQQMKTNPNKFDFGGLYLIYILDGEELNEEVQNFVRKFSNFFISNIIFMLKQNEELVLTTVFPFTHLLKTVVSQKILLLLISSLVILGKLRFFIQKSLSISTDVR